jgi:hypothetical protein
MARKLLALYSKQIIRQKSLSSRLLVPDYLHEALL